MNALAIALHGVAATIWIGGMFFAYVVLRPSVAALEPHRRLTLWDGVFQRFFPWVWAAVLVLLATGYWLMFRAFGGFGTSPVYVHIMHLIGLIMLALFAFLYFRPWSTYRQQVRAESWPEAGAALHQIRQIVLTNLILGIALLTLVYAGRYGLFA